jgi:hypothetical protein
MLHYSRIARLFHPDLATDLAASLSPARPDQPVLSPAMKSL